MKILQTTDGLEHTKNAQALELNEDKGSKTLIVDNEWSTGPLRGIGKIKHEKSLNNKNFSTKKL